MKKRIGLIIIAAGILVSCMALQSGRASEPAKDRLSGTVVLYLDSMFALVNGDEAVVDKTNPLVTPFLQNDRTLVPLRFIAESFGAKVSWDGGTQTAAVQLGGRTITITAYMSEMTVDGKKVALDVPAMLTCDRTFLPLRAVAEALGKNVFYSNRLVILSGEDNKFEATKDAALVGSLAEKLNVLPKVSSRENLIKLLEDNGLYIGNYWYDDLVIAEPVPLAPESSKDSAAAEAPAPSAPSSEASNSADFSTTNIQVEGVDEGDIVKTDGTFIYHITERELRIYKAYPAADLKLISTCTFQDDYDFYPHELYISGNILTVVGRSSEMLNSLDTVSKYHNYISTTKVMLFDVSNKEHPAVTRQVSLDGDYLSSRMVGSTLYFMSNKYIYYYADPIIPLNPCYMDTAVGSGKYEIPFENIEYCLPVTSCSYLLVAGLDITKPDKELSVETILGSGNEIYMSPNYLYVSAYAGYTGIRKMIQEADGSFKAPEFSEGSYVYKFSLKDGQVSYIAKGFVPGRILNQFSMDEYGNTFRAATTKYSGGQSSGVYVFGGNMEIIGSVEGLAPGEQIYSARFMGNRAYVVTFKTTDPLFVIDLTSSYNPKVLGALKIPGYSDYLHPYDETHLIGFGKDTIIGKYGDAYYLGMKISLFDVSDVANPKETAVYHIGDRGTSSYLLSDHRALLFDKAKGLLAFPVVEAKVNGPIMNEYGYPEYGETVFNGAYVLNISLDTGFSLRGKITHASAEDTLKSGYYSYDYIKQIQRLLYIGDVLYGVSPSGLSAHKLSTLEEIKIIG